MDFSIGFTLTKPLGVILLGWVSAALVNYLADVLPRDRKIVNPFCIFCSAPRTKVAYLFLRKCSWCSRRPTLRVWIVQILTLVLFLYIDLVTPGRLGFFASAILILLFILIFVIDVEHRLILNEVALAGAILCLLSGIYLHGLWATLGGGLAGYVVMLGLYALGVLFNRTIEKVRNVEMDEVALGYGDVTLSGVLGLVLGFPGITAALFQAIFFGGLFSGGMLLAMRWKRRYQPFTAIPYAPFLIIGAFILLFRP